MYLMINQCYEYIIGFKFYIPSVNIDDFINKFDL